MLHAHAIIIARSPHAGSDGIDCFIEYLDYFMILVINLERIIFGLIPSKVVVINILLYFLFSLII